MILFHLIMISMIISYVILYVYIWKGENFPPIPLDQFPVHIFSVDSEILQGTQSGKLTGNITFLFLYNSLYMDTRSIIFVYIIDVWTLDPSSFDILLMYGHSIHYFLCIIDVWTLDPSSFDILLMYGRSIHYFSMYYWCMDTRSIPFWYIVDVWTLDPFPFELQTVAIVCLNTVLSLRVKGARLCVWYNLVLMDPLNTMVPVCSPFNSSYTGISFLYGKNL